MKISIVFATQRSGSTLLCNDIKSIGGLGAPGEHFLPVFKRIRETGRTPPPADILTSIKDLGVDSQFEDVLGVKIMVNYVIRACELLGMEAKSRPEAIQKIADWASKNFSSAGMYTLRRSPLVDQALSRAEAQHSGIYHRHSGGEVYGEKAPFESNFHRQAFVMREMIKIIDEQFVLGALEDELRGDVLKIAYEDLVERPEEIHKRISDYSRSKGFAPKGGTFNRGMKKIISREENMEQRKQLKNFLDGLF